MKLELCIPFEENGFLSSDAKDFILPNCKELYEFAHKINCWIYKLYTNKELNINNEKKKYFLIFWVEMHKTYQSIIILTQRGLQEDAFTLLRRMYEMLFKVVAISKDSDNIYKIKQNELYEFSRLNKKLENNEPGTEIFKQKNINFKDALGGKKVSVADWAKMADMMDVYNCQYFILCDSSHVGYSSLNSSSKKNDEAIDVLSIPMFEHYNLIVTEAISIMFDLVEILIDKLKLKINKELFQNYKATLEKFC